MATALWLMLPLEVLADSPEMADWIGPTPFFF